MNVVRRSTRVPSRRGHRHDPTGQSVVEFALVIPVLMLILMSIIQLGFLFSAHIGVINGVREGARYGSLSPTTASNAAANGTSVETYIRDSVLPRNVPGYALANVTAVSVSYCSYANPGGSSYSVRLLVQATYAHPLFIPLVGAILDAFDGAWDSRLAITSSEQFRVENLPLNSGEVSGLPVCP